MHQLAVFGNPIGHSRSPQIHSLFAEQNGLAINCERILVPVGEFDSYAQNFIDGGGRGFSITSPFKNDAYRFAQRCTGAAAAAEAVNAISVETDGVILGDNTDGAGLMRDIIANLKWTVAGKQVLILGAGGAVQGIVRDVLAAEPASVDIHNRTPEKAADVARRHRDGRLRAVTTDALRSGYDLVINGTSASLLGGSLDLPDSIVCDRTCCYDLSYGESTFLNWCVDQGAPRRSDGLGMLVEQAALAFNTWFGVPVDTEIVIKTLREGGDD